MKSRNKLKIGDISPVFSLPSVDGKIHTLNSFSDKPFLVIFMCNHCPYVKAKINHIKKLQEEYKDRVNIVGINSNDPEYDPDDGFENMKRYSKRDNYNFVYLFDETQDVARAYGASCTPDPFLFNKNKKLVYHGRINNQMEPSDEISEHDMRKAFECVLNNKKIDFEVFPSIGCSIKWKSGS